MISVEPSGIIMKGICSVQFPVCTAKKENSLITAVWAPPGRTQVDVCNSCLQEKIKIGDWEVKNSRLFSRADIVVISEHNEIELAVEVKLTIKDEKDMENIKRVYRNLMAHAAIPKAKYFMLITGQNLFLWETSHFFENLEPLYKGNSKVALELVLERKINIPDYTGKTFEDLIFEWFIKIAKSEKVKDYNELEFFKKTGLLEKIIESRIYREYSF